MAMIQLNWQTSEMACVLHAARAHVEGARLADSQLAAALTRPAGQLQLLLERAESSAAEFLRCAMPLSIQSASYEKLSAQALSRLGVSHPPAGIMETLSGVLGKLDTAVRERLPKLLDQLALRMGPLRDAWEARGPGLWKALGRIHSADIAWSTNTPVNALCLQPLLGGRGEAFPGDRLVTIEAMLANPHNQLPEVVRLGWLLARIFVCQEDHDQRECSLTLLPAVLQAAEEVELARCDPPTLRLALDAWRLTDDTAELDALAEALWRTHAK